MVKSIKLKNHITDEIREYANSREVSEDLNIYTMRLFLLLGKGQTIQAWKRIYE